MKMGQTQPMVNKPAPASATASVAQITAVAEPESDAVVNGLSIVALLLSLGALVLTYLNFAAANPQ
ncbi:MAG: hypothetical protein RLZZ253_2667 [Verrucomicrobiota bacterium]|jgi:hypothetical protein